MIWAATIVLAAEDLAVLVRYAKTVATDAPLRGCSWVVTSYSASEESEEVKT